MVMKNGEVGRDLPPVGTNVMMRFGVRLVDATVIGHRDNGSVLVAFCFPGNDKPFQAEAELDEIFWDRRVDGDKDHGREDSSPRTNVAVPVNELAEANDRLRDQLGRAHADIANIRRRSAAEAAAVEQRAKADLLLGFLGVLDNLDRALKAMDGGGDDLVEQTINGITMVREEFVRVLAQHDVHPISALGQPFDSAIHEALAQAQNDGVAPGVVVEEFERGYMIGGRVLRAARVVVSS